MLEEFYEYLVSLGLSEYTKSGRKSTVYSYCKRIELVCKNENMDISQLARDISVIIPKYDYGGIYEDIGMKSSKTCINALKAFKNFVEQ